MRLFKKRGYLIILISLILIISGCQLAPQSGKNTPSWFPQFGQKTDQISSGGSGRGLNIEFVEEKPPREINAGKQSFKIALDVFNYGDTEISGNLEISETLTGYGGLDGFDSQNFVIGPAKEVDQKMTPAQKRVEFGPYIYDEDIPETLSTNIIAKLTYNNYLVRVHPQICIKREDQEIKALNIRCENREVISGKDLGYANDHAPIAIDKIEKIIGSSDDNIEILLKIYFRDVGGRRASGDEKLFYSVNMGGLNIDFDCSPEQGAITLEDGLLGIICTGTVNLKEKEYIINPLNVNLKYSYEYIKSIGPIQITSLKRRSEE